MIGSFTMYEGQAAYENAQFVLDILKDVKYKADWSFGVAQHSVWRYALEILLMTPDSRYIDKEGMTVLIQVKHQFEIPDFAGDRELAEMWLFQNICVVEKHESAEIFRVNGDPVFYPNHDRDPYLLERRVKHDEPSTVGS